MDNKTIFVLTLKGQGEIKNHTHLLPNDVKRVLALVDDESSVEMLARRAAPSLRDSLNKVLQELESGGFIQTRALAGAAKSLRIATPKASPAVPAAEESGDLDFTVGAGAPPSAHDVRERERAEAEAERVRREQEAAAIRAQLEAAQTKAEAEAKARAEAEARAQQVAEAARRKVAQEAAHARAAAEAVRVKAEQEAAKAKAELEAARQEAERARAELNAARMEAEALAKREAEAARLREEATARIKAEREAAQAEAAARLEAEAARIAAEAEAKARQDAEAARRKAEEEVARAKAEAEARAREEAEAARRKADEEIARARAEGAAKAREEAEIAKRKAEEEIARTRAEAEARAREEAEAAKRKVEEEIARAKAEAEARAREEAEVARRKVEEEIARTKAEAAARAREEAEAARRKAEEEVASAKAEAEAARLQAEREAARIKAEFEAAQAKAEAEARSGAASRADAERKAKHEADSARLKAEQEAAKAQAEAEARARQETEAARAEAEREIARIKAEADEQVRQADQAKVSAESALAARIKADTAPRSMIATVLFFDVVGYTKQSVSKQIDLKKQFNKLVSNFIEGIEENRRIILDTGDGAAIGFLQHPEDAIDVALKFRRAVTANSHRDYPDMRVRMGINLGPVNVVKDMNGQSNMLGDGINDAQRIMSFAPSDCIYISRSYFDVVSRLSAEYARLFKYRGVKNDKHGRQHQVYEATDESEEAAARPDAGQYEGQGEESSFSIEIDQFVLDGLGQAPAVAPTAPASPEREAVAEEAARETPPVKTQQEIEAEARAEAERKAREEAEAARIKAEAAAAKAKAEEDARRMADEQAKAWAEAEQRAKALAEAQVRSEQAQAKAEPAAAAPAKTVPVAARARRKPMPPGKIIGGLLVLALVLVAALPYIWPLQGYIAPLENKLSAQLQQPVHIARIKAALLPLPKLELQEVSVGAAQELKATNVTLHYDFAALFAETKTVKDMDVDGLTLDAGAFAPALSWLQAAGGVAHYPVEHMVLRHVQIGGDAGGLPPLQVEAFRDAQGQFGKVLLRSEDGKLDAELQAQQSRWAVTFALKGGSLPWLPGIVFDDLEAKGEAGAGAADFSSIDGMLYGGKLTGNTRLSWQDGWKMQGRLSVHAVDVHQAMPQLGVEGEMDGDGSFSFEAAALPHLADAPRVDGTVVVKKGVIDKIDLVEAAANHADLMGGRTHFDELSCTLQVENNSVRLQHLRISAGVMNASGAVGVNPDRRLSGRLLVELKMRAGSVPIDLSGTLAEPHLSR